MLTGFNNTQVIKHVRLSNNKMFRSGIKNTHIINIYRTQTFKHKHDRVQKHTNIQTWLIITKTNKT